MQPRQAFFACLQRSPPALFEAALWIAAEHDPGVQPAAVLRDLDQLQQQVSRALPAQGFTVLSAKLGYKPKNPIDPGSLSAEHLEEVEAFLAALDANEDVQNVFAGYAVPGNDHTVGPRQRFYDPQQKQNSFDPDKAKFHYQKSGHSGPVLLRTSDVAFTGAVDAAQLYQQSCAAAGITVAPANRTAIETINTLFMFGSLGLRSAGGRGRPRGE